jgi:hypothetical protein
MGADNMRNEFCTLSIAIVVREIRLELANKKRSK